MSDYFPELRAAGFFAVLRGSEAAAIVEAGVVMADAGVHILEVSFTCPDATSIIAELRAKRPDDIVGAGTVLSPDDVTTAVDAGSQFVVSPGSYPALVTAMIDTGLPCLPGVQTPSEYMAATNAGAKAVKLFPASIWSPAKLRELRGPFPTAAVVPTGGIALDDIRGWLDAGAMAVGLGSQLCSDADMRARAWDTVVGNVRRVRQAVGS